MEEKLPYYIRMKQAVQWYKRNYEVLQRDIAESMKITEVSFSNGLKRLQTKLDEDFIIAFHQATGGKVSLEWLLTGKGEMVANTAKKVDTQHQVTDNVSVSRELDMANRVIESLERERETSNKLIKEKDDHIDDLRQQLADITKLAEERLHRIAELRRIIDAHDLTTTGFPIHPLGTAEDKPSRRLK